jgi:hypothetical protein
VSFAQELKDFSKGFAAGSDIRYRRAAAKNIEMNLPILGPGDLEKGNVPGTFQPGGGGGVGETSAPRVTGGSDDTGGKRPRPRSLQEAYRQGIANIESGGGNYNAVGKQTSSGDRAYGKYQIMGANIPVWTKQWLGHALTPEQFVKSPEAQDFVFDNVFGGYVKKYGLEGAARAWFGGEGAVNDPNRTDIHGKLTTGSYGRQFAAYVTNLGDLPDVSDEERRELAAGINPNAVWDDTGFYPQGKDEDKTGAIPEEAAPTGEETPETAVESPVITAPEVDLTPQVQEPELVGDEEEEHYAMGGVIPEDDTPYFAAGGATVNKVDPYNTGRAYTQMAGAGYKPPAQARRITLPAVGTVTGSPGWRDWGAGKSPTQMKVTAARNKLAADRAAAAAAAATPAPQPVQQQQQGIWQPTGQQRLMLAFGAKPESLGITPQMIKQRRNDQLMGIFASSMGPAAARGNHFAKGGKVAKRKEPDWAALKRKAGKPGFEETIERYRRPGNQRGDAEQEARDRAAREMNVRSRGLNSTAWREPYLRPAAATAPQAAPGQVRPAPPVRPVVPTPTPRPPVTGGEEEGGRMPQVDTMGNPVGANYPEGFDTPGEVSAAIKQDPGWATVQKKQEEYRRKAENPQIDIPAVDPVTGEPLETQPAMAHGGVIPDAPASYARGGRVEEAGYTTSGTGRRSSARKKSDPWAGLRTKTSEKVRKPSTKTVKRGAAKRKKKGVSQPGRERRQGLPKKGPIPPDRPQALPERGPIPPARPERSGSVPPGTAPPIRDPGGLMQPIGTLGPAREPFRPADTQGASPFPPPNARVPMPPRPQQGPPAPAGGLMAPIGSLPRAAPQEDPRAAFIRSEKNYPRDLRQEQAVRGGPASPPVDQTVRPARPGDYGPALSPASRGMQVFQDEEAPGEPIPERFGRGPEAEPLPERFGREPVQGGLPPEYYYEEEPEVSAGGAFGFQRGGVIPDDTDTPFRQRAGRRSGLQLRLPTQSYAKGSIRRR